jgi:hypothetical protein
VTAAAPMLARQPRHTGAGGSWDARAKAKQRDAAINAAHALVTNWGITMSPAKVARLVRRFDHQIARNGWTLFEFLAVQAQLTLDQRHLALQHPDVAKVVSYSDPTGETATHNVWLQQGRRR